MIYRVQIRPSALRELERLPAPHRGRVAAVIDSLAAVPRPEGCRKLMTVTDGYRVHVGVYRVVYIIQDDIVTVTVVRVRHRRDVYRDL